MTMRFRNVLAFLLALLVTAACAEKPPAPPVRKKLRIIIPQGYKEQIGALMASGVQEFSSRFEDIDWVDLPWYSGRDAIFAPSLAARLDETDPDADILFIDLYRLKAFRPGWLTQFKGSELSSFRPAFLQAAKLGDGNVYAVPWSAKGNFLFYRKDLVPVPPKTWKELRETCEGFRDRRAPKTLRFCLLMTWNSLQDDLYPLLWSQNETPSFKLDSDASVEFMTNLAKLMGEPLRSHMKFVSEPVNAKQVNQNIHRRFAAGESVFMITWNNRFAYMKRNAERRGVPMPPLGIAPIPSIGDGKIRWSNIGTWGWIVPRAAKNATDVSRKRHNAAMQFVSEVSSLASAKFLSERYGLISARADVAIPGDLRKAMSRVVVDELNNSDGVAGFSFRDRGSDSFTHGFVRDAEHDVLMCGPKATGPMSRARLGNCARYKEECKNGLASQVKGPCGELNVATKDEHSCLRVAVKRRLCGAQQQIERVRRRSRK
jgi:ABC-type glycerol-3-phosphate transport system substrate-binding protein